MKEEEKTVKELIHDLACFMCEFHLNWKAQIREDKSNSHKRRKG